MAIRNITLGYDHICLSPFLRNGIMSPKFVEYVAGQTDPSDFEFEHLTGVEGILGFIHSTWALSFVMGTLYVGGVFGLQYIMKNRNALELKKSLFSWNILVGSFSIFGFCRAAPELIKFIGKPNGFYESICIPNFTSRYTYWGIAFGVSKVPELIDTFFVVLRKKPLEGVQWYHHLVTMIGCWIFVPYFEPYARYMVIINFGVHGIMYPYFALKVAGVEVPRLFAKVITTFQFAQMVICMAVNLISAYIYLSGTAFCHRNTLSLWYTVFVNMSFLVIFGDLFLKLVVQSKRASRKKKTN